MPIFTKGLKVKKLYLAHTEELTFCVACHHNTFFIILQHRRPERSTTRGASITALSPRLTLTMTSTADGQR